MAWQLCSTASPHKEKSKHFCTVITAEGICMILTQPNSCDRHQGHTPDLQQSKDIAYYSTGSLHNDSLENDFCSSLSTHSTSHSKFHSAGMGTVGHRWINSCRVCTVGMVDPFHLPFVSLSKGALLTSKCTSASVLCLFVGHHIFVPGFLHQCPACLFYNQWMLG
jgi:hypothetical protein